MAVPRNRLSTARRNARRSHHAKKPILLSVCPNCKKEKRHHSMCMHCGYHKGRSYLPEES